MRRPIAMNAGGLLTIGLGALLLLVGCAPGASVSSGQDLLDDHGLSEMTAPQIVDHLDRLSLGDRPADLIASVRPDSLLLTDGERELSMELPPDSSYVSIAPYLEHTHDCFFHSLTTCTGELSAKPVEVRIVDASGEVLVHESTTTFDNGFIGFWLPRGTEGSIQVNYQGRTGEAGFSTAEDGATCITTLQLT